MQKAEFRRPPAPFTTDWGAAQSSVERMAELRPMTVSAGHGPPMSGRMSRRRSWTSRGVYATPRTLRRTVGGCGRTRRRFFPPPQPDHVRTVAAATALAAAVATVTLARRRNGSAKAARLVTTRMALSCMPNGLKRLKPLHRGGPHELRDALECRAQGGEPVRLALTRAYLADAVDFNSTMRT